MSDQNNRKSELFKLSPEDLEREVMMFGSIPFLKAYDQNDPMGSYHKLADYMAKNITHSLNKKSDLLMFTDIHYSDDTKDIVFGYKEIKNTNISFLTKTISYKPETRREISYIEGPMCKISYAKILVNSLNQAVEIEKEIFLSRNQDQHTLPLEL